MLTQQFVPDQTLEIVREIDCETRRYLSDILAQEKITAGELICSLIHDRWISLKSGSEPQSIAVVATTAVATVATAPSRKNSKQMISDFMRRKCHSPNLCI
jgi:hypothetical protein